MDVVLAKIFNSNEFTVVIKITSNHDEATVYVHVVFRPINLLNMIDEMVKWMYFIVIIWKPSA